MTIDPELDGYEREILEIVLHPGTVLRKSQFSGDTYLYDGRTGKSVVEPTPISCFVQLLLLIGGKTNG